MTRRKKYAIMMKTRCAKGENAVENLIPRWYRELELFRGVKPLLVLEGCVMDQVRVPVTGSVAEDTLLPLSAFLNAYLSDAGYEQVVFYSNLVGLMNPYAPEMLDNFAKTNQAEVVRGERREYRAEHYPPRHDAGQARDRHRDGDGEPLYRHA